MQPILKGVHNADAEGLAVDCKLGVGCARGDNEGHGYWSRLCILTRGSFEAFYVCVAYRGNMQIKTQVLELLGQQDLENVVLFLKRRAGSMSEMMHISVQDESKQAVWPFYGCSLVAPFREKKNRGCWPRDASQGSLTRWLPEWGWHITMRRETAEPAGGQPQCPRAARRHLRRDTPDNGIVEQGEGEDKVS